MASNKGSDKRMVIFLPLGWNSKRTGDKPERSYSVKSASVIKVSAASSVVNFGNGFFIVINLLLVHVAGTDRANKCLAVMVAQREGNKDTAPFAGLAYGGKSLLVLRVGRIGENRHSFVKCGFKGINRNTMLLALVTIAIIPLKPCYPLCNHHFTMHFCTYICQA